MVRKTGRSILRNEAIEQLKSTIIEFLGLKLINKLGLEIEVIDLRTIAPLDKETIINSVKKTSRLLIAHEDVGFVGFGAEISAIIAEEAFNYLDAPIKRVTSKFSMIGQAPSLENDVLPNRAKIKAALLELLEF